MKYFIGLLLSICIMGCATPLPPKVVTETVYVVRTASIEQKTLPEREFPDDVTTDAGLAAMMVLTEKHIELVVKKFNDLIAYYEKPNDAKGP